MWKIASLFVFACCWFLLCGDDAWAQAEPPPPSPKLSADVPRGVEVQARGPVHEAFAGPVGEPQPAPVIKSKPSANLEELPPDQRPEGSVVWVGGYWAFDDDRQDFLWVSGCWRAKPPSREWVPGYWHEVNGGRQWVPGAWAVSTKQGRIDDVTYMPQKPPSPPKVAPPGARHEDGAVVE